MDFSVTSYPWVTCALLSSLFIYVPIRISNKCIGLQPSWVQVESFPCYVISPLDGKGMSLQTMPHSIVLYKKYSTVQPFTILNNLDGIFQISLTFLSCVLICLLSKDKNYLLSPLNFFFLGEARWSESIKNYIKQEE